MTEMEELLFDLEQILSGLEEEQRVKYLAQAAPIKQRVISPDMKLAVIGNFSCGKSTFLNAVLKKPLLSMDMMPTTAIPTYLDWNERNQEATVAVTDSGGKVHRINDEGKRWFKRTMKTELPRDRGDMIDYLTTTNSLSAILSKISISFPGEGGYKGFCIIDTPGVNPGEEEAADHVWKTQEVLRQEADAAIVLFPSYCVYTRDFGKFLKENANHLIANSIFVVTKMDLVHTEKERKELIRYVKRQLEANFKLDNPEVYGCSAGCALDYYVKGNKEQKEWTLSFEQMIDTIFSGLHRRREQIVTGKTIRMMENLIQELKAEIEGTQAALIQTQEDFVTYSYANLKKEYRSSFAKYKKSVDKLAAEKRPFVKETLHNKVAAVKTEACEKINNSKNANQLNQYLEGDFPAKAESLGADIEKFLNISLNALNKSMAVTHQSFLDKVSGLLDQYRYNVGDFTAFTSNQKMSQRNRAMLDGNKVERTDTGAVQVDGMWGVATKATIPLFVLFGIPGLLIGALFHAAFIRKRTKVAEEVGMQLDAYENKVFIQNSDMITTLRNRFVSAGEKLLEGYEKEYKKYFEEKERELRAHKQTVECKIRQNEQRIRELERLAGKSAI